MAWFLWEFADNWPQQLVLLYLAFFGLLLFIKALRIYCNVERTGNALRVKTLFSTTVYNLDELTAWTETTNIYRVRFRKLRLEFGLTKLEILDQADPANIEALFHYLRTHFSELRN